MSHGIPFDVAFEVDPVFREAASIVFGEFESAKAFDWTRWEFPE